MIAIEGHYFDGLQPVDLPARMDFVDQEAVLTAGPITDRCATVHLKVSPRIGSADRFITFPNGAQFSCADHSFLDSLPQESPSEGPVAWLEKRWGVALACVAIIICTVLVGYFFGLPFAAEGIANRIPMETEQSLGRQALGWLDENRWFMPTKLDVDKQKPIIDGFDRLRSDLPLRGYYQLEFRSSETFGPNALALPGGIIVITEEMVRASETTEEVLAVLAHEAGHVELRHAMRSVFQNSVVAVAAAAVTSDATSLSVAIAGLPTLLAQRKYSRKFETAADDYAFRLLKRKGYSPTAFASIMERLAKKDEKEMGPFAYVSTHPLTAERVRRARAAAADNNMAIEINPRDNEASYNRGLVYGSRGEYDQAISNYDTAIEINQNDCQAYIGRGNAYSRKGQYDQAILDYSKCIEINPRYALAYYNRGLNYGYKGQYDQAISDYSKAIEIYPEYAQAYYNRGLAYGSKGQYDQEIADYSKAIKIDPGYAAAYINRGVVYSRKGQYDQAISDHNNAIKISPRQPLAYYNRGRAYYLKKDYDKSWKDINKAQELGFPIPSLFLEELRKASGRQN